MKIRIPLPHFKVSLLSCFAIILLLYYSTISSDLLHIKLSIFKIKLNNAISAMLFLTLLTTFRRIKINKEHFNAFIFIFTAITISAANSSNYIACLGFMAFFVFNYLVYFVLPDNLFMHFSPTYVLKYYFLGFYLAGAYAACQVFFSVFGIDLPGVKQWIYSVARGQSFSYEPSFYALYMTPFAIFQTSKFILANKNRRIFKDVFWATFFLLVSTSTGCFFSYASFIFFLFVFRKTGMIPKEMLSATRIVTKSISTFALLFSAVWIINKDLIVNGYLKLFYSGFTNHFTFQCRWQGIVKYWQIFLENPLIGVGLGGGTTYFLKKIMPEDTVDILDPDILNTSVAVPMNVTTEVIASLGLFGISAFIYLFYKIGKTFNSSLRIKNISEDERLNLISLALSLCVVFITLQFSQSIMRAGLWLHVGICMGYANYILNKYIPNVIQESDFG